MNDGTKKVLIISAFACSMIAVGISIFLVKQIAFVQPPIPIKTAQKPATVQLQTVPVAPIAHNKNPWVSIQKEVRDTVIQIFSHVAEFNWLEPYKTPDQVEGFGTGFFINEKGDIITNYHVIGQASSIEIQIPSCGLERSDVQIVGVCPDRDIALLTLTKEAREKIVKALGKIPFLRLGDSDRVLRSQEVLALGYPLGQTRLKSTVGVVSGRERLGSGFIQISAPLNPGNSGGPALNTNGEVIGINSRGILEAQNVGYIIPINEVSSALKDLYKTKLLRKPTLGCIFTAATPEMVKYLNNPGQGGWYIAKVFKGTLLESVGIKEGDMLYKINGHTIDMYGDIDVPWSEDKASLFEFLNRLAVGDSLNFVLYRKGGRKEFTFKFEHTYLPPIRMIYPEFEQAAVDYGIIGGLVVMQLSLNHLGLMRIPELIHYSKIESQHEPALIITHILPNSQAFKARILRPGEIIEEVNGTEVKTLQEFRRLVLQEKNSGYLTLRTDDNYYAVLSLDKIIREEDMLAARYFFEKTPLVQNLATKPEVQKIKAA